MNDFDRILTDNTREIEDAKNVPARLFRQILFDRRIGPSEALQLMHAWIADPKNHVPQTLRGASYVRGNLIKEFSNPKMSWKVFIKALRWLRLPKVTFIARCHWSETEFSDVSVSAQFYQFTKPAIISQPDLYDLNKDEEEQNADPQSDIVRSQSGGTGQTDSS